ncbi:MAG: EAL domain-containing protein [Acidimicrobiales bacterium]
MVSARGHVAILPTPAAEPREAGASQRQIKGALAKMVLSYVRRVLGQDAVDAVLAAACDEEAIGPLLAPGSWISTTETLRIAAEAARICGEENIGRRTGEEMMRVSRERGTIDVVRASGSVAAALATTVNLGTKMSSGRVYELTEVGDGHATIVAKYVLPADASPFYCGQAAGYYGLVPDVFGYAGVIAEPECMCRGDARCVYKLRWSMQADGAHVAADEIAASRDRADSLIERFEQVHTMAAELANAENVDTVLARVADRAGIAIHAPRYLLAARTHEAGRLHIHHKGFDEDLVAGFAGQLLAGELVEHEGRLIADIASGGRVYGRLAALYPRGSSVSEAEKRLLSAYARHAAAALDAVASLEAARRDRDMAQALLALAQSLAVVSTRHDVACRVAAAVPAVVLCEQAGVWLWDDVEGCLRLAAESPSERVSEERRVLHTGETPGLAELVRHPTAVVIEGLEMAGPTMRILMEENGVRRCFVVPIMARGGFLGVVAAGFLPDEGADEVPVTKAELLARLGGLADHAATALDNADLITRVREQALRDALTGLPNRRLMEERAQQALLQIGRTGRRVSFLFVDLDRFKNINDTLGHEVGDELIRQVADRLQQSLRASDTLARLGGDEFVVMLPDIVSSADADVVAEAILQLFKRPFCIGEGEIFVTCSIGVAIAPDHGHDYTTLLRHADAAMYEAKQAGRNITVVYTPAATTSQPRKLELESDLHTAVERGELHVLYQPQIDLRTSRVVGVEALVRWDHPELGRLAPDRFIPMAEESGLIAGIDDWVRDTAFRQARTWLDSGIRLRMAVNLSTRVLRDSKLAENVAEQLAECHLDPDQIELEITDRVVMDEHELGLALARLCDVGVRLAIDDFGTGSSVLGRLQGCPIDTLKIDRSFVSAINVNRSGAPIVTALLSMAEALSLDVVAEGVETDAQAQFLRGAGCQLAQGFLFSRPIEASEVEALIASSVTS